MPRLWSKSILTLFVIKCFEINYCFKGVLTEYQPAYFDSKLNKNCLTIISALTAILGLILLAQYSTVISQIQQVQIQHCL